MTPTDDGGPVSDAALGPGTPVPESMLSFGFATICYYSIKHLRFR